MENQVVVGYHLYVTKHLGPESLEYVVELLHISSDVDLVFDLHVAANMEFDAFVFDRPCSSIDKVLCTSIIITFN